MCGNNIRIAKIALKVISFPGTSTEERKVRKRECSVSTCCWDELDCLCTYYAVDDDSLCARTGQFQYLRAKILRPREYLICVPPRLKIDAQNNCTR